MKIRTRGVAFVLVGEKARGGQFPAYFSSHITPVSSLFYSWNTSRGLYGKQRPKSPSPASLSDRTVILKRITYHKLNFLSSEDVSKVEMNWRLVRNVVFNFSDYNYHWALIVCSAVKNFTFFSLRAVSHCMQIFLPYVIVCFFKLVNYSTFSLNHTADSTVYYFWRWMLEHVKHQVEVFFSSLHKDV